MGRKVVLNSDSEGVLLKGLRRFARQIRREHGLIPEKEQRGGRVDGRPPPPKDEELDEGGTAMEVDSSDGSKSESDIEAAKWEGRRGGEGGGTSDCDRHREALLEAAGKGEAPGLLGEYLRGSPQLNDLLHLWDMDQRKVGSTPQRCLPYDTVQLSICCVGARVLLAIPSAIRPIKSQT